MSASSLTLDQSALEKIIQKFDDPKIKRELEALPSRKAVAAIIAQAIADNFDKEGPGWPPLKKKTIERSVKNHAKKIKATKQIPQRRILQLTGALKKSVTSPGAKDNVWRTEGSHLIWGTDLVYAGVHNQGNPSRNIPQRKFLTIREEWMKRLNDYLIDEIAKILRANLTQGDV